MFWRQQLPNLRRAVGLRITLLHFVTAIGCFWTLTTLAVGSSPSLDAFVRANVTADRFSEHTSTADASLSSFLSHDASLRGSRNSGTFLPFRELSNSSSSTSIEPSLSRLFPIDDPHHVKWNSWLGVWYIFVSIFFVLFAGLASGLTLGLMSIDPVQLRVLEETGTAEQKRGVEMVSQVIHRHHLLLVTLLLANSIAMEALPIFLDRLVPSWAAVLISVTAVLFFGEIIPQAVCTGRNQLSIAQAAAPFVNALICIFFVVSWPIAKLLDFILGKEELQSYYARAHLKALIRMHQKGAHDSGGHLNVPALETEEVVVIEGALDLAEKTVQNVMVPITDVFMLNAFCDVLKKTDTVLDKEAFWHILKTGHSRIPVYEGSRENVKGLLLTKSLLSADPLAGVRAGELLAEKPPLFTSPSKSLYKLLNDFKKSRSHMAFVTEYPDECTRCLKTKQDIQPGNGILGIVTLEDVIEELIQEEIYDEFDQIGLVTTSMGKGVNVLTGNAISAAGKTPGACPSAGFLTRSSSLHTRGGRDRLVSSKMIIGLDDTLTGNAPLESVRRFPSNQVTKYFAEVDAGTTVETPRRVSQLPRVVQHLTRSTCSTLSASKRVGIVKYTGDSRHNSALASMAVPFVARTDDTANTTRSPFFEVRTNTFPYWNCQRRWTPPVIGVTNTCLNGDALPATQGATAAPAVATAGNPLSGVSAVTVENSEFPPAFSPTSATSPRIPSQIIALHTNVPSNATAVTEPRAEAAMIATTTKPAVSSYCDVESTPTSCDNFSFVEKDEALSQSEINEEKAKPSSPVAVAVSTDKNSAFFPLDGLRSGKKKKRKPRKK